MLLSIEKLRGDQSNVMAYHGLKLFCRHHPVKIILPEGFRGQLIKPANIGEIISESQFATISYRPVLPIIASAKDYRPDCFEGDDYDRPLRLEKNSVQRCNADVRYSAGLPKPMRR